jgi:hypothetical protein
MKDQAQAEVMDCLKRFLSTDRNRQNWEQFDVIDRLGFQMYSQQLTYSNGDEKRKAV